MRVKTGNLKVDLFTLLTLILITGIGRLTNHTILFTTDEVAVEEYTEVPLIFQLSVDVAVGIGIVIIVVLGSMALVLILKRYIEFERF